MATNFPTSLDNFTNPSSGNTLDSPSHSLQHSDANDAIEAIEAKLGVGASPAGSATAGQVLTISAAGTSAWTTPSADGLIQIVPSSVSVGSGSATVNSNGSITVTTVSSLSINDIFSSNYDEYLILLNAKASASNAVNVRLRASGSDATNSTYNYQFLTASSTTVSGSRVNTQTSWDTGDLDTTEKVNSIYIYNPYISGVITSMAVSPSVSWVADTNSNPSIGLIGGSFTTTGTAYTGCSLIMAGGTMTGRVSIYGFRK